MLSNNGSAVSQRHQIIEIPINEKQLTTASLGF